MPHPASGVSACPTQSRASQLEPQTPGLGPWGTAPQGLSEMSKVCCCPKPAPQATAGMFPCTLGLKRQALILQPVKIPEPPQPAPWLPAGSDTQSPKLCFHFLLYFHFMNWLRFNIMQSHPGRHLKFAAGSHGMGYAGVNTNLPKQLTLLNETSRVHSCLGSQLPFCRQAAWWLCWPPDSICD